MELPLSEAKDHFAAQGARDALVELSRRPAGAHRRARSRSRTTFVGWDRARATGLAEIRIPDLQPGSSIMPGKVNPVAVRGGHAGVRAGHRQRRRRRVRRSQGNFELNVYLPVIARNLLESIRLLANVTRLFADRCIAGIEANVDRLKDYAESSPSIGTALNPYIGYEKAAQLVKQSTKTGRSIRELALERDLMTEDDLDRALDVLAMTEGGLPDELNSARTPGSRRKGRAPWGRGSPAGVQSRMRDRLAATLRQAVGSQPSATPSARPAMFTWTNAGQRPVPRP